jgi:hypothetical protein
MENSFHCETCNYKCKYNSEYLKHLNSQKHARQGKKKIYKCSNCDYETKTSNWNLKMHTLTKHSSKEERTKYKYYCNLCDSIFFSPLYLESHMKGSVHTNNLKLLDYNTIGEIPNEKNNKKYIKKYERCKLKTKVFNLQPTS